MKIAKKINFRFNFFFLLLLYTLNLSAATRVVDNGSFLIFNCEGISLLYSYTKIQDAIDAANAGDTISVCDGTYSEELEISYKNNLILQKSANANGSVIVKNSKTILQIDGVDGLTVDSIEFDSSDKSAIEISNWSDNILFENLIINSDKENAIDIKSGVIDIQNSTITAKKSGISNEDTALNGFSISDSNISTLENSAISFKKEVNGFVSISNISVNANDGDGIYFEKAINNGISISDSNLDASGTGINFKKKVNGFITLSNLSVNANDGDGINFEETINNGILIESSEINATQKGIAFKTNVNGDFNIDTLVVYATEEGISLEGGQANPIINNSNINSQEKDAITTKSAEWTNFILQDSCVKTQKDDKYSLDIDIKNLNTSSEISSNCFYAPSESQLASAKAAGSGSKFDGNYWDGVSGSYEQNNISDTTPLDSCPNSCGSVVTPIPLAYYKFDECSWDAAASVIDSGSNEIDLSAYDNTTSVSSNLGRAANFDGDDDYIGGDNIDFDLSEQLSVSVWMKWSVNPATGNDWANIVSTNSIYGQDNGQFALQHNKENSKIEFVIYTETGRRYLTSTTTIEKDVWYYVVGVYDGSQMRLYINGALESSLSKTGNIVSNESQFRFTIGKWAYTNDSWNNHRAFTGAVDELKVYDAVLSASEIEDFYNQSSYSISCNPPIVDYRFDECFWDGSLGEIIDSSGNGYHATRKNFLDTNTSGVLNRYADGEAFSSGYIEPEFTITLPDSWSISTWIKFPLDSNNHDVLNYYGSYYYYSFGSVPTSYSYDGDIAWLRTSSSDINTIEWGVWDGTDFEYNTFASNLSGWHHIAITKDGSSTKIYLDSTYVNSVPIGVSGDINYLLTSGDNTSGQAIGAGVDEYKIYDNALSDAQIKIIYDNESAGKNYDGNIRDPVSCGGDITHREGNFTVVDKSSLCNAISNWDNNITTKIAGETKQFWVLAKDKNTSEIMDNATIKLVQLQYYGAGENNTCSGPLHYIKNVCEDCGTTDSSGCLALEFTFENRAAKCVNFYIEGVDANSSSLAETNATSVDNFALRPKNFNLPSSFSIKAGESFNFDIDAYDNNNTQTLYYDANATVTATIRKMACSSQNADLNISMVNFINGQSSTSAKFDDVGIVDINVTDKTWASVDSDDTPQNCNSNGTYICNASDMNVTIVPYRFVISDYDFTKNPSDDDWLYMTDVNDMNITYNYNIRAQNESNNTTENFDALCYAENVGTFINFTSTSSDGNISYYEMVNNTVQIAHDRDLNDFNLSATINDQNFTNGVSSEIVYALNVYREFNNPKNPMSINITDINTTNSSDSENVGLLDNNGSRFYFGRLKTSDIESTEDSVKHLVEVEVYADRYADAIYTSGLTQNSLKWYKNLKHNSVDFGNIYAINAGKTTTYIEPEEFAVSNLSNPSDAQFTFDIDKHIGRYIMHVKTDYWLWYALDGFGDPYDDSNGSSCLSHPCFTYIFKDNSGGDKISSGEFQGGDANVSKQEDYTKKGVKVYR